MRPGGQEIIRRTIDDLLIASVRYVGEYGACGGYFDRLLRRAGPHAVGPPFCLFADEPGEAGVEIECCVPVDVVVEGDDVRSRVLPGTEVLSITHRGPYRTLGEAWETLFDVIEGENLQAAAPRREIYLDEEPAGSESHVTELQVPLDRIG